MEIYQVSVSFGVYSTRGTGRPLKLENEQKVRGQEPNMFLGEVLGGGANPSPNPDRNGRSFANSHLSRRRLEKNYGIFGQEFKF
jgi:hypothetical protein